MIDRTLLAMEYGDRLPVPKKPKIYKPGFFLGIARQVQFSPCGNYLFVRSNAGHHFWEIATGKKLCRIKTISNPWQCQFINDGKWFAFQNESREFSIHSVPDGKVEKEFKVNYEQGGLTGAFCYVPKRNSLFQLAYSGVLLEINADSGEVVRKIQLSTGVASGDVHYLSTRNELFVTQYSHSDASGDCQPCFIWHGNLDCEDVQLSQTKGRWKHLRSFSLESKGVVVLCNKIGNFKQNDYEIEVLDSTNLKRLWYVRAEFDGYHPPQPEL